MKVTQEKLPASQIGLEIEITPEMSKQAYDKAIQGFMRSVNIPGFRRGKVPRQVLVQRLGEGRIKASVIEELMESGLKQAIEQEKIEAIGNYQIRSSFDELIQSFQPGEAFTFSASIDVAPEATLKTYKGLAVTAEEVAFDPAAVDEAIEGYRSRAATLVPVEDRPTQFGDLAVVDFVGRVPAEEGSEEMVEFAGGSATDFQLELQEGRFIAGFIDGIIGMNVGDTKEVTATFPPDYPQEDLAGQPAIFTVTVKEIKAKELPDLDDDFAQEVSEFETMAEFRESVEASYRSRAEKATQQNKEQALLEALEQQVEVDLPETIVREELNFMLTQTAMNLSQQGLDIKKLFTPELVERLREQSRPEALIRLRQALALSKVAEEESIELDEADLQVRINEIVQENPDQNFDMERLRDMVSEELLREKVLGFVEEHSQVELVPEGSLTADDAEAEALELAAEATVETDAVDVEAAEVA
ncbi:MAG: trigger factor, partial [Leptolyngbya sp. DLM2.Bin15]